MSSHWVPLPLAGGPEMMTPGGAARATTRRWPAERGRRADRAAARRRGEAEAEAARAVGAAAERGDQLAALGVRPKPREG